jgi:glutamate-1-semialdehyde 2,1-aminomutase
VNAAMATFANVERWITGPELNPLSFRSSPEQLLTLILFAILATLVYRKIATTILTLKASAFQPQLARRLSEWVKSFDYSDDEALAADGATQARVQGRKNALARLSELFRTRYANAISWGNQISDSFSDLRFTDANRVPFPFVRMMREKFKLLSVVTESRGPKLHDLDDNWNLDVSGSYGLNLAGFDRYKTWMKDGLEKVQDLGPVLGPIHPIIAENIAILKSISGKDEVSFHMSGTEAVMAAVRMARFNTRRKLIVCFSGAYHGWWDGVQPGLGSERTIQDCLTLKEMNQSSLAVLRRRAHEIAAVLINPIQSFHPNMPPPSDAILMTSEIRRTETSSSPYAEWLRCLREVCTAGRIPLIFDEVFSGFRLAPGGAQEYFGVQADIVVYGKTVAGGMPIGVVCGQSNLMRRFDPGHPMRIAYVVGTFSAHPVVMGCMNEFLKWVVQPSTAHLYDKASKLCDQWVRSTNESLSRLSLPVRVMNFTTIWTVLFNQPGRYNWLLQYYLRAEGINLSWVGTGRCMSSLDFTEEDYQELETKLVNAVQMMKRDGWWLSREEQPAMEKAMRTQLIWEGVKSIVQIPKPLENFYVEIMQRKKDDHHASHSNLINQFFHLLSSSTFIVCYFLIFFRFDMAMFMGMAALFVRQFGHAILEPPCHDKEKALLGFNTRNKSIIVGGYFLIPIVQLVLLARSGHLAWDSLYTVVPAVAEQWFLLTLAAVFGRVIYLIWAFDFRTSMVWFVKLITDPITDIAAYYRSFDKIFRLPSAPTGAGSESTAA